LTALKQENGLVGGGQPFGSDDARGAASNDNVIIACGSGKTCGAQPSSEVREVHDCSRCQSMAIGSPAGERE
jgi:hypothetical protein